MKISKILKKSIGLLGIGFATATAILSLNSCKVSVDPINPTQPDPVVDPTPTQPTDPVVDPTQPTDPVVDPTQPTTDPAKEAKEKVEAFIKNLSTDNFKVVTGKNTYLFNGKDVEKNGVYYELTLDGVNVYTKNDDDTYSKQTTTDTTFADVGDLGSIYQIKNKVSFGSYMNGKTYLNYGDKSCQIINKNGSYSFELDGDEYTFSDFGAVTLTKPTNIKEDVPPVIDTDYVIKDGQYDVEKITEVLTEWLEETDFIYKKGSGKLEKIQFIDLEDNKLTAYYTSKLENVKYFGRAYINVGEVNTYFVNKQNTTSTAFKNMLNEKVPLKKFYAAGLIEIDQEASDEDVAIRANNILAKNNVNANIVAVFESVVEGDSLKYGQGLTYSTCVICDNGKLYKFGVSALSKNDVKNNTDKWGAAISFEKTSLSKTTEEEKVL